MDARTSLWVGVRGVNSRIRGKFGFRGAPSLVNLAEGLALRHGSNHDQATSMEGRMSRSDRRLLLEMDRLRAYPRCGANFHRKYPRRGLQLDKLPDTLNESPFFSESEVATGPNRFFLLAMAGTV